MLNVKKCFTQNSLSSDIVIFEVHCLQTVFILKHQLCQITLTHQYLTRRPSHAPQLPYPAQNGRRARPEVATGRRAGNEVGSHSGQRIWGVETSENVHPTRKVTVGEATLQAGQHMLRECNWNSMPGTLWYNQELPWNLYKASAKSLLSRDLNVPNDFDLTASAESELQCLMTLQVKKRFLMFSSVPILKVCHRVTC